MSGDRVGRTTENEKRDVVSSRLTENTAGFRILHHPDAQMIMFVPECPSGADRLAMILRIDQDARPSRTTLLFERSGRAVDDPT